VSGRVVLLILVLILVILLILLLRLLLRRGSEKKVKRTINGGLALSQKCPGAHCSMLMFLKRRCPLVGCRRGVSVVV